MPRKRLEPVWTWGEAFKDGKLYCFDPRRILVARPWPDLRAWVKTPCRPWHPTCMAADRRIMPGLDLPEAPAEDLDGLERRAARSRQAFARFFEAVPAEALDLARPFPERRWQLLNLFARCPGALDLGRSNPALALALACNRAFHRPGVQRPYRAARALLPRPQRDILRWLGFPGTEAARRILRKLYPEHLRIPALLGLRKLLQDPAHAKLLAHLPAIQDAHLQILFRPAWHPLANPAFFRELAEQPPGSLARLHLSRLLWEIRNACSVLDISFELPRLRSLEALSAHHDHLAERLGRYRALEFPPQLPEAPFPGTSAIQPIRLTAELFREGAEMGHCVASHLPRIQAGQEAVYRILAPLRATLSIVRAPEGWTLDQIAGARNAPLPPDIQEEVLLQLLGPRRPAPAR